MATSSESASMKSQKKRAIFVIVIIALMIFGQFTKKSEPVAEVKYLTVYRIEPNVFYDSADKVWYWGVNFRTDEAPMTLLNCRVDVLDKTGKTILSEAHQYNVVNDSTVIRYGGDDMAITTKEIAKAIDSFNIFCSKPKG